MLTPELRKASSRRRCSSVAKSNSTMVKVFGEGKNVTSVPRLPPLSPTTFSGATATPSRELHEMFFAVAPDGELEPARQRVDHRDADAVQAAGHLVGILVEFSAGMQLGHDDLGRRDAFALVDVGRDAAAVVAHGHRAVGVERDHHLVGEAGKRLVDGVVDHLVDHVVQAGAVVGVADIHARPLAHGVEALEDLDQFRAVVAVVGRDIAGRFSHRRHPQNGRKNESDLSFGVTRNLGLVQSKVTAVNMLIQNEFLKSRSAKNGGFLSPVGGRFGGLTGRFASPPLRAIERPWLASKAASSCTRTRLGL